MASNLRNDPSQCLLRVCGPTEFATISTWDPIAEVGEAAPDPSTVRASSKTVSGYADQSAIHKNT